MTEYWVGQTGLRKLAVSGGVGLNVKLNGNLFASGRIDDIFIHPLCSDTGMAIASAMTVEYQRGTLRRQPIEHVSLGPGYGDGEIEAILKACKLDYTRPECIERTVAGLLDRGLVVGWFQGRMEGGPRALGNRSILADPRRADSRDRVNAVVKFREFWRPFCPSMTKDGDRKYLKRHTRAPFMIITFDAAEGAEREIEAVVHVDGTSRVQIVAEDRDVKRYVDRIKENRAKTGVYDAVILARGRLEGQDVTVAVQDFSFQGGSLGMAAGEAIVAGMTAAVQGRTPFIIFTASGGARMQEGMFALMQMPRTTVAVRRLRAARLPYIVVFTNPTTGGVTASYAMLGDVHIAEPGAVIGFAGARVIEQTIRERLPEGFQRAEYLRLHGMVDMVVPPPPATGDPGAALQDAYA